VHSLDRVRLLVSALFPHSLLHGLAATAAMLTCVAVVLNVGPFSSTPRIDGLHSTVLGPAPSIAQQPDGSSSMARGEIDTRTRPLYSQSAVEPENVSEPIETLIRKSSLSVVEVAPSDSQPAPQKAEAGETDVKLQRQDSDSNPAPQLQPNRASPDLMKRDVIVGVWAPDAGTCSARNFRDGVLPTVINTEGAWAGDTFCIFTKKEKTETGWMVVAKCSSPREHWTSSVRLTVSENRLTWASKRGTQAYTRCEPDVLMAEAK
jgi:hypothetical protein